MGVQERLEIGDLNEEVGGVAEHRLRYELAARVVNGLRTLDLGCGVGYGSAIIAETGASVTGVDISTEAVRDAEFNFGDVSDGIDFVAADAIEFLRAGDPRQWEAIVAFEVIEHVDPLDDLIEQLNRYVEAGVGAVLSVPNSRFYEEENEFHVTDFDLDLARRTFERIGPHEMLYQYLAEGSVISPDLDGDVAEECVIGGRHDPGAANTIIGLFNFEPIGSGVGRMNAVATTVHARYRRVIERANRELWHVNARFNSALRSAPESAGGVYGSAAAAAVRRKDDEARRAIEENEQLRRTVSRMEGSLSWRITRPLRWAKAKAKSRNDGD